MLHAIAENFSKNQNAIADFFKQKTEGLTPPLYLSCDIRNSGRKLGVVDTNLFPAGFNNLCNAYSRRTAEALRAYFRRYHPGVKNVILLMEEHTRNRYYLENISRLSGFLKNIELNVAIAYLGTEIQEPSLEVVLNDGSSLTLHRLQVRGEVPEVPGFTADLILSNNDFSQGIPEILQPVLTKILPSPRLGWHSRKKSRHFALLAELTTELARRLDLDPWLLQCLFEPVESVDVSESAGLQQLAEASDRLLRSVQEHYDAHHIEEPPYVFVKNNSGTYGMGVIEVMQPEEISQMNRRIRNKLLSAKGGQKVTGFLVQEGIPTADFYSGYPIEPVIYMVGFEVVGGFFRMNPQRDALSSLNARGMEFSCLCLHKLDEPHEENFLNCAEKASLVSLSSVMARLAALASAHEMKEV